MRPAGEVRAALRGVLDAAGSAGSTWRDAAKAAQVGYGAARSTVDNMHRSGELVVIGARRGATGRGRPSMLFAVAGVAGAPLERPERRMGGLVWADFCGDR